MSKRMALRNREDRTKLAKQLRKENVELINDKPYDADAQAVQNPQDNYEYVTQNVSFSAKDSFDEKKDEAVNIIDSKSYLDEPQINEANTQNNSFIPEEVQEHFEEQLNSPKEPTVSNLIDEIEDNQNYQELSKQEPSTTDNFSVEQRAADALADNPYETENVNSSDDPDLVPVQPTLNDEEVPNLPGAILRHARELCRLSQREIARRLDIRVNSVADLEHDRLFQPTAAKFAKTHLANYARIVGIDEQVIVNLYDECLNNVLMQQGIRANTNTKEQKVTAEANKPSKSKLAKYLILAILALLVAAIATISYAILGHTEDKQEGSLVIENNIAPVIDNEGGVLLDNSNVKTTTVVEEPSNVAPAVDKNTLLVQQAQGLDEEPLKTQDYSAMLNNTESKEVKEPLSLKRQVQEEKKELKVEKSEPITKAPVTEPLVETKPLQSVEITSEPQFKTKSTAASAATTPEAKVVEAKKAVEAKTKQENVSQNLKSGQIVKLSDNKQKTEEQSVTKSNEVVSLSNNTRDVSSQVKLRNRDPLAGSNTVKISVRGDVALTVTANGKVLKSGKFSKGQNMTLVGIPPFKISVSDASRISISYSGGSVVTPNQKQVSFTLPQR